MRHLMAFIFQLLDGVSDLIVVYALAVQDQQQLACGNSNTLLLVLLVLAC
jgi:hypothetical protein